jgi:hypothetical protein
MHEKEHIREKHVLLIILHMKKCVSQNHFATDLTLNFYTTGAIFAVLFL